MDTYEILSKIKSPDDLKQMSYETLEKLCAEIRAKLVETVSANGGHLSPNLGVVELTVMLHKVFNAPKDSIVWDVGHQCYTHKMLTGRFDKIDTIRTENGISGFPKRSESCYDDFNAGHSSTSISAAYGIARAKQLCSDDSYTIAVIGDGSFSGGLAFEGMNNAGRYNKNFIVILNDNKMSISHNVGAMARYFTRIRLRPGYLRTKQRIDKVLMHTPLVGRPVRKVLVNSKSRFKTLVYKNTLFEDMGFSYYGPVDGHDLHELNNAMIAVKKQKGPVLLHVVTTKGKGYHFAENDPKNFHGIGKFDIESGEPLSSTKGFSACFGDVLCRMAKKDDKICAITAAMKLGTGLDDFAKNYRERFFDVGIAEEHAVTFGCGLASRGMLPVFAVYSTFLQRTYDQLLHDSATQKLHLVLAVDRAGIVGEDGETHQGVFDVSMLNSIPNVTIFSPCYFEELELALESAIYKCDSLVAVRYPRGTEGYRPSDLTSTGINYDIYGNKNAKILIVTYGRLFSEACKAKEMLLADGIDVCILKLCKIKPIDSRAVKFALDFNRIYFFEEGIQNGGTSQMLECQLAKADYKGSYKAVAIDDKFIPQSSVKSALKQLSLDSEGIYSTIKADEK